MSAQPDGTVATPPNMVDIGGEKAVVIPLTEYRAMKALADRATPEEIEAAQAVAEYLADKEGMRARGVTDDELDAELDRLDAEGA